MVGEIWIIPKKRVLKILRNRAFCQRTAVYSGYTCTRRCST